MPAGNTVDGRITAVSPVALTPSSGSASSQGSGSGGSSMSTIPVTIRLSGRQSGAGLDQASVSVNFQQQEARHVLSVPVTALIATAGAAYAVQEAAAPHHLIPVTTGLFAAGYVQIARVGLERGPRRAAGSSVRVVAELLGQRAARRRSVRVRRRVQVEGARELEHTAGHEHSEANHRARSWSQPVDGVSHEVSLLHAFRMHGRSCTHRLVSARFPSR